MTLRDVKYQLETWYSTWGFEISSGDEIFHLEVWNSTWRCGISPGSNEFHLEVISSTRRCKIPLNSIKSHLEIWTSTWRCEMPPGDVEFDLGIRTSTSWGGIKIVFHILKWNFTIPGGVPYLRVDYHISRFSCYYTKFCALYFVLYKNIFHNTKFFSLLS